MIIYPKCPALTFKIPLYLLLRALSKKKNYLKHWTWSSSIIAKLTFEKKFRVVKIV